MEFLLAFIVMLLVVAGMAIGAMAGRGPLRGSCGGLSAVGSEGKCDICGDDPSRRKTEQDDSSQSSATYYDASAQR